jgi:hypothetical protein
MPHLGVYHTPLSAFECAYSSWPIECCKWWIMQIPILLADGKPIPPPVLRFHGDASHILDGNHRVTAARHHGLHELAIDWQVFALRVVWDAFCARHGLRLVDEATRAAHEATRQALGWRQQRRGDYEAGQRAALAAGFTLE